MPYFDKKVFCFRALGGTKGEQERIAGRPQPEAIGAVPQRGVKPSPERDRPEHCEGNAQLFLHQILLILLLSAPALPGILHFEGLVPPDIDKAVLEAEYHRIYRIVAPRLRPDPTPLRIVYYSDNSIANLSGLLPEWGGGGTIGPNLIVVPTTFKPFLDQSFAQVTRHELVHAILERAYPGLYIPRWFHEGAAMTLSGELSFQEDVVVSKAIFAGTLMPLASIDSVNAFGRNRADLAYAKSHLAVLFLVDRDGIEALSDILSAAKRTGSFWQGMAAAVSLSPPDFDYLLSTDIASRYRFAFIFADYSAFWVGIAFLFLVAAGVALVRKQKKLAQMEREEREEDRLPTQEKTPDAKPQAGAAASPDQSSGDRSPQSEDLDKEFLDVEEFIDDDDDDYILSDGVELEDEEDDDDGEENNGDKKK